MALEEMSAFFTSRAEIYDEHMLKEVKGCKEGYEIMAENIPVSTQSLLDLGCGTGLELNEIFKKKPDMEVTGIDMTPAMLSKLKAKYSGKNITLICKNYVDCDFGADTYDAAVSFETMHHLSHEDKILVYKKVLKALKCGGIYIECDYMAHSREEENFYYKENSRLRKEQNIPDGAVCHYDTPCTVENQVIMLEKAGFSKVKKVWNKGNTVMLTAEK